MTGSRPTRWEQDFFAGAADKVRDVIAQEAASAGFHFRDVGGDFTGHEVCAASDDWLFGLQPTETVESFHPNEAGQRGYDFALEGYIGAKLASGEPAEISGLPANP